MYSSSNTIRMMKLRMRWTSHVVSMLRLYFHIDFLVGKAEGKSPVLRIGVHDMIIL